MTDPRTAVADGMAQARADLEALVAIPSIAFAGSPPEPLAEAAALTADLLRGAGLGTVEIVDVPGAPPAVVGESAGPPGAPTVLLYAHYDVQPPGPEAAWTSPAFAPQVRENRVYGRGAADDKSGIVLHVAALRALAGELGVTVRVVVEGDEETGNGTFEAFVRAHPERFAADVIVVADAGNWRIGEPSLYASLRGVAELFVEVATLKDPAHSGLVGGAAPDALLALIRMLDTLTDAEGGVAVEGLARRTWDGLAIEEETVRGTAGVLDGVQLVGHGAIAERLYSQPAITVVGLDAPPVATAANALVPRARAKVSVRLAPGDDPDAAVALVEAHLRAAVPWGAQVAFTPGASAMGFAATGSGPGLDAARRALAEAYGKASVDIGSGGSIPLVTVLAEVFPDADIVVWGAQDEGRARIHAGDESVDLAELERAILAEVLLLADLGDGAGR